MRKITTLTISLLMVFILPAKALLGADTGQADRYEITKVTDGDSLRSGELRIRLHGMDAPEMRQSCTKGGVSYACGLAAQAYLETMLASSGEVRCEHLDTDRYQRLIMRCYHRGIDIAAAMVRAWRVWLLVGAAAASAAELASCRSVPWLPCLGLGLVRGGVSIAPSPI